MIAEALLLVATSTAPVSKLDLFLAGRNLERQLMDCREGERACWRELEAQPDPPAVTVQEGFGLVEVIVIGGVAFLVGGLVGAGVALIGASK